VPADGDAKYLNATAITMREVVTSLGQSKAREVLAFVDSCFSGAGGRSVLPAGARPLVRVRDIAESAPPNLAILSSSGESEIAGPTAAGNGGLFTQFLIEALGTGVADINGDGQISLGELSAWVKPRVAREARQQNESRTPSSSWGRHLRAVMIWWSSGGYRCTELRRRRGRGRRASLSTKK
jgi:hypothetical protein